MKDNKIKITMTEEQQIWLLRFLNREWDEEVEYRLRNGDSDTSYLEDLYDVYKSLLGNSKDFFSAYAAKDDLDSKKKDIKEIKENGE